MPGNASESENQAQPQVSTDGDFSMIIVGYSTKTTVPAGKLTGAYNQPPAAASDLGAGDAVDALLQALTTTQGNPSPPPASFCRTPATSPGSYAGPCNTTGVSNSSTAQPANNDALPPTGTFQPWIKVVKGFAVGTAGGTGLVSLDGGRTQTLVSFGTATEYNFPASDGFANQAGIRFDAPASTLAALYTGLNNLRTAAIAHYIITTGSPAVHAAADTADNVALTAVPVATTPATAIALYNALISTLVTHEASAVYHTTADTVGGAALAALLQVAVDTADCEANLAALITAYNAHRVLVGGGPVHGSADSTNTCAAYSTPGAGTLSAGDTFYTATLPPMFAAADLFAAGPPATGAFAAIAESSQLFGVIVISEPICDANYDGLTHTGSVFSTLVAGLNYGLGFGKRWHLIVRFRDPMPAESDAAYTLAFQAFKTAHHDNRIEIVAGSLFVTDAFTGRTYLRSGLAPYLARVQSFKAVAGQLGERLAQNPGWVARGPLEGASLKDAAGNTIGHDEAAAGGIEALPGDPIGGGTCFYYQRNAMVPGTYVTNRVSVLYPVLSEILTPMDRRVANAIETVSVGLSLTALGGADVWDPATFALDDDIRNGLEGKIARAILDNYSKEFQNPTDPNVAAIDPTVSVSGPAVTLTGENKVRFYGYTDAVALRFAASR